MKKIVIGFLLMSTVPLIPIIGYFILYYLDVPNSIYHYSGALYGFVAVFQILSYGSLVVSGFKEANIHHLFHS